MTRLGLLVALFGAAAAVLTYAGYDHVSYSWMGNWGATVAVFIQLGVFIGGVAIAAAGSAPDQTGNTKRLAR